MKSKDLRLLLSLSGGRRFFFVALTTAAISTAVVIANAYLIAEIIVGIIDGAEVTNKILTLAAIWAVRSFVLPWAENFFLRQAASMKEALRNKVTSNDEAILSLPASTLSTLLIKGSNSLDVYIARFFPQMISATMIPFVVIATIFIHDRLSAVIAVITLPLIPVFGALIGRFTQDSVSAKWQSLGTLASYFEDSLRGIHTLAIFGRAKKQGDRIREMGDKYTRETMKVLRISFLSALALELAATISVALIAVSIGLRLVNSSIEFLPSLIVLILAPEVYFPLRNAASLFHASADGALALDQLTEKSDLAGAHSWGSADLDAISTLTWSDFTSPFSSESNQIAGRHVSSGEIILVTGESGFGKTTFLHNLLGVRRDCDVRVNGRAISEYNDGSLYQHIGWIPQIPTLIPGTVRELFRKVDASLEDDAITALLNRAALSIADLSDGLDSIIGGAGEKDAQISGGQIRRIAIARAIARKPSLIIADEPTADLDPAASGAIYQLLNDLAAGGAIVVVVAHDDASALKAVAQ